MRPAVHPNDSSSTKGPPPQVVRAELRPTSNRSLQSLKFSLYPDLLVASSLRLISQLSPSIA